MCPRLQDWIRSIYFVLLCCLSQMERNRSFWNNSGGCRRKCCWTTIPETTDHLCQLHRCRKKLMCRIICRLGNNDETAVLFLWATRLFWILLYFSFVLFSFAVLTELTCPKYHSKESLQGHSPQVSASLARESSECSGRGGGGRGARWELQS